MATTATSLSISYADIGATSRRMSFKGINPDVTQQQVKSLCDGLVTAGDIFTNPPVLIRAAAIVTTETTPVDLNA